MFVATDFDGDSIVIDAGATVTIENDIPGQNSATVNINVDEDELTGLSTGITDNDGVNTVASFTAAQLAGLVASGADEPVTVCSCCSVGLGLSGSTSFSSRAGYNPVSTLGSAIVSPPIVSFAHDEREQQQIRHNHTTIRLQYTVLRADVLFIVYVLPGL